MVLARMGTVVSHIKTRLLFAEVRLQELKGQGVPLLRVVAGVAVLLDLQIARVIRGHRNGNDRVFLAVVKNGLAGLLHFLI